MIYLQMVDSKLQKRSFITGGGGGGWAGLNGVGVIPFFAP